MKKTLRAFLFVLLCAALCLVAACSGNETKEPGNTPDDPGNVHVHSWDNGSITKEATCVAEGVKTFTCSCGETKTETIPKLADHIYDVGKTTKEATCQDSGTKVFTCTGCGITKTETIPKLTDHTYDAGKTTKEATCQDSGTKVFTCTGCGITKTETIPKLTDHIYDAGKTTKAATCKDAGTKVFTCTGCGITKTETIPKLTNHTYDAGKTTKAATCKDAGTKTYTCTGCGITKTETIPKLTDHTYDAGKTTKAATCKDVGTKTYTCTVCGVTKDETIPKLTDHTYDAGKVSGDKIIYTCTVCGTTKSEDKPLPGNIPFVELKDRTINGEFYSKEAQVLIAAADAYVQRGVWIQYDDTYMDSGLGDSILRSPHNGDQEPERANEQNTMYTNCAAWIHNLFWEAFDYNIGDWYTRSFMERSDIKVYSHTYNASLSAAEKQEIYDAVEKTLIPGDLIVTRHGRPGNETGGHIMLYVGDGKYVHSSGQNYIYNSAKDNKESNGSVGYDSLKKTLLTPNAVRDLLNEARFVILRPLSLIKSIPEKSITRFQSAQGIVVQKLSSHPAAITANPGDTVTYTIKIMNTNKEPVFVEVESMIAANTALVSGGDTVNGNKLGWKLQLRAGETKSVTYTVKISENVAYGSKISDGVTTFNGIRVYASDILIAKTLTEDQIEKFKSVAEKYVSSKDDIVKIAKRIYKEALGVDIGYDDTKSLFGYSFVNSGSKLAVDANAKMAVDSLYGGMYVLNNSAMSMRTQMIRKEMLLPGDILITSKDKAGTKVEAYLVLGGGRLLMQPGTSSKIIGTTLAQQCFDKLLGSAAFIVIRPSQIMK